MIPEGLRFVHPWLLAALALVPLLVWWQVRQSRRATPSILFSDLAAVAAGVRPTWRLRVAALLPYLRGLIVALGIMALARPQHGTTERSVRTVGLDISLAIDLSQSMAAMDLVPNRLEAAKAAASDFVRKRTGDRISLVIFAKGGAILCPPTLDHETVQSFIRTLDFGVIDGTQTAVGTGLGLAVDMLKDSTAKGRVVVLLTDGVNNYGNVTPIQSASAAQALGVRVYSIGAGTDGEALVPVDTPFGRTTQRIQGDVDERTLTEVAEMTGGRFFRARDTEGLNKVYAEIDKLEKTELEVNESTSYEERFFLLWLPALVLLGIEFLLRAFVLRRLP